MEMNLYQFHHAFRMRQHYSWIIGIVLISTKFLSCTAPPTQPEITLTGNNQLRLYNPTAEDLLVELFNGELFVVGIVPFTERDCRIVSVDGEYTGERYFTTMDTLRSGQTATYPFRPNDDISRRHEPNVLFNIALFELKGFQQSGVTAENARNLYVYSPRTEQGLRCAKLLLYTTTTEVSAADFPQNLCDNCPP